MIENFQKELSDIIEDIKRSGEIPHLLLHACCAPCSSYVLEYLSEYFRITLFYYNPNISPETEYAHRVSEIRRFVNEFKTKHPVTLIEGKYEPARFYAIAKGMESLPEGGERCRRCYALRLSETAKLAKELDADYFTTTLTISPQKSSAVLNEVAEEQARIYGVKRLPSDFKKKAGYLRSIELSHEYNLYRQNFCGCVYSMREALARDTARSKQKEAPLPKTASTKA